MTLKSRTIQVSLIAAVFSLSAFTTAGFFRNEVEGHSPPPTTKILRAPRVVQSTSYSCGAASLLSALYYYGNGDFNNESEVMKAAGTDPKVGTEIDSMAALATAHHVPAQAWTNLSISHLAAQVNADQVAIVEMQAWPDSPKTLKQYAEDWDDGHYIVVIGVDDTHLYFMDPSMTGGLGSLTHEEFNARWHDIGRTKAHMNHTAILFAATPKPPSAWQHIP